MLLLQDMARQFRIHNCFVYFAFFFKFFVSGRFELKNPADAWMHSIFCIVELSPEIRRSNQIFGVTI